MTASLVNVGGQDDDGNEIVEKFQVTTVKNLEPIFIKTLAE